MLEMYKRPSNFNRRLFSAYLEDINELPGDLVIPGSRFVCFLACDGLNISIDSLTRFVELLLEKGLVYLAAWGPNCSWVHDVFDEVFVQRSYIEQIHFEQFRKDEELMTSWHINDNLDEALWFGLCVAAAQWEDNDVPDARLAIVVGNREWHEHVSSRLSDIDGLIEDVAVAE